MLIPISSCSVPVIYLFLFWLHTCLPLTNDCMRGFAWMDAGGFCEGLRAFLLWTNSGNFSMFGHKFGPLCCEFLKDSSPRASVIHNKVSQSPLLEAILQDGSQPSCMTVRHPQTQVRDWSITNGSCCILLIDYNTMLCSTACSSMNTSLRRAG